MERGTYLLSLVSVKKVSKDPGSPISVASGSRRPSAFKPCSRRYLDASLVSLFHPLSLLLLCLLSLSEMLCFFFLPNFPNRRGGRKAVNLQLPSTVTELSTSLADMKMADLD